MNVRTTSGGGGCTFYSVAISPNGTHLVSGSIDMTVKVWDAVSGELISTLTGHTFFIRSLANNPDGTQVASAGGLEEKRFACGNFR